MMRFVIGDIHGSYRAMIQCFERSGFSRANDLLICLGDLADGWPDTGRVFDELLAIKNFVLIRGNHDQWLLNWFRTGEAPEIWLNQGGYQTISSMGNKKPEQYHELLERSVLYYKMDNYFFVHGGILTDRPLEQQSSDVFLWDRSLIKMALLERDANAQRLTEYDMVFVGHTPTINFGPPEPITNRGVCLLDTGAGWPGGKLTILDISNMNYYSSDPVDLLYPGISVR